MQVSYQKDFNHHYLVMQAEQEVSVDTYPVRMLLGNTVEGLLPCRILSTDVSRAFCYDITSTQSITGEWMKRKVGEGKLRKLLIELIRTMEEIQSCLMDVNQLVFLPEYMYENREKGRLQLCYLPGYEQDIQTQFRSFMENLLPLIDHEDSGAVVMGYGIYRQSLAENFSLEQVKKYMYQEVSEEPAEEKIAAAEDPVSDLERQEALKEFFSHTEEDAEEERKIPWGTIAISGIWTVVLLGIGGLRLMGHLSFLTFPMLLGIVIVILGVIALNVCLWKKDKSHSSTMSDLISKGKMAQASIQWPGKRAVEPEEIRSIYEEETFSQDSMEQEARRRQPGMSVGGFSENIDLAMTQPLPKLNLSTAGRLISKEPGNYPDIDLTGDLTIFGKLKDAVDAVIPKSTVSRVHAKLRRVDQEYYLMDLNSKNGTYINGALIAHQENCRVVSGDEITFADAGYTFMA